MSTSNVEINSFVEWNEKPNLQAELLTNLICSPSVLLDDLLEFSEVEIQGCIQVISIICQLTGRLR